VALPQQERTNEHRCTEQHKTLTAFHHFVAVSTLLPCAACIRCCR
jgi:hypothetical protein